MGSRTKAESACLRQLRDIGARLRSWLIVRERVGPELDMGAAAQAHGAEHAAREWMLCEDPECAAVTEALQLVVNLIEVLPILEAAVRAGALLDRIAGGAAGLAATKVIAVGSVGRGARFTALEEVIATAGPAQDALRAFVAVFLTGWVKGHPSRKLQFDAIAQVAARLHTGLAWSEVAELIYGEPAKRGRGVRLPGFDRIRAHVRKLETRGEAAFGAAIAEAACGTPRRLASLR